MAQSFILSIATIMQALPPGWTVFGKTADLQKPFDVAVVMPAVRFREIDRAVASVYAQTGVGRIQLLVGVDRTDGDPERLIALLEASPEHVTTSLFYPGYPISLTHGGMHPADEGGVLRSVLTYLANSRYVAYLDDDNWWDPTHLKDLLLAVDGRSWAFSLRWFVDPESSQPLCIDDWESVGPGRGILAPSQGGYVDLNCLLVDKPACLPWIGLWGQPLTGDDTAMNSGNNVYPYLQAHSTPGETQNPTAFCVLKPKDSMYDVRLRNCNEKRSGGSRPVVLPARWRANAGALMENAESHLTQGRLAEAGALLQEIIRTQPDNGAALHLLGTIAVRQEQYQKATELIGKAIETDPANATFHSDHGFAMQCLGFLQVALQSYEKALAINPDLAVTHLNRGNVLKMQGNMAEANASYDSAAELLRQAGDAEALHALGTMAYEHKEYEAAVELMNRALEVDPKRAATYSDRGLALQVLGRIDEALESYDRALALDSAIAVTHFNRGNAFRELRQLDKVLENYDRALSLNPGYADVHWNKSLELLTLGRYEEGFASYEWRWKQKDFASPRRNFPQPLWLGKEDIAGKTILLHSEQGYGDTIQFCRYIPMVAARGARVVLEAEWQMQSLVQKIPGVSAFVAKGLALPEFDLHCPLVSLALAFGTTVDTVPSVPRYLEPDPERVEYWEHLLGRNGKPRVGLAWSGKAQHQNDRNRSASLAELIEYLPPGFQYVCLQKEIRDADRQLLGSCPHISDYSDQLHDFGDTAALCELMDLIVSVDTSVAHLGGALGKKTWVLLPFVPDWRWLLDRDDSPWYPASRLYRQDRAGDWPGVFCKVGSDLREWGGADPAPGSSIGDGGDTKVGVMKSKRRR
ncbi:MAG: tetratricopeptide repeat protein [Chlorobiaceae bacterium]|nr:tetratricopeptide repeat protein [Chlorobiaceae bacterium]